MQFDILGLFLTWERGEGEGVGEGRGEAERFGAEAEK